MPETHYQYVGKYELSINGKPYRFHTLVSKADGTIAWMPDNEQQHVNPQCNENHRPIMISNIANLDIYSLLQDIMLIRTKELVPLEIILSQNRQLAEKILADFQSYQLQ